MGRRASVGLLSAATLLGLAVILLLAPGAAAVPNCTSLALKQSRTPRTTSPGKRLRFTYTIRNTGATRDVALGIIIPLGVKLTKQSSTVGGLGYKHLAPVNASIIDARLRSAFQVFWPTQTLLAKKTRKYKATFEVVKCEIMPEELLFYARASEIVDNAVVCNKDFESQRIAVRIPKKYTPDTSDATSSICPLPYALLGVGVSCAEAVDPAPVLGANPSFDECYAFCYDVLPPPSYFQYVVNETAVACGCAGNTCTPVMPSSGSFLLETLPVSNAPPSPSPTPTPPPPPGPYPPVVNGVVTGMLNNSLPFPANVWISGFDSTPGLAQTQIMSIRDPAAITAATGISPINSTLTQGPFDSAFLQQTFNDDRAAAYGGLYFYPPNEAAFNGMLFKDFVLNGMEGSFDFYLLTNPKRAPSYKFSVMSFSTWEFSTFMWTPAHNEATQGPVVKDTWLHHEFNENTGSTDPWPTNTAGGNGWWCTQKCLMGPNPPGIVGGTVFRSLRTMVEGLLSLPTDSTGYKSIQDAVIIGIQLGVGAGEKNVATYTANYKVSTPRPDPVYQWSYSFGQ